MDPQHWQDVCALFERVRTAPRADREPLLAAAPELRAEVEELMSQHETVAGAFAGRADHLPAGEQLGGYTIEGPLGRGGMGTVYRARDASNGIVALKVLHGHLQADPQFVTRFRREASLGMRVVHPNVVRTLGTVDDTALVLELIEGQTLAELAEEQGKVSEDLCRHLAREVAAGLAAIHAEGIVHRDLKPGNVLVTPEHQVKLTDLGIAISDEVSVRLSLTGQFIGTLLYSAPEQLMEGEVQVDGRADLYALGILLYELSAGRHPIVAEDMRAVLTAHLETTPRRLGDVNPQVSPFFEEVVHTLLAKRPDDRFASAVALAEVLTDGEDGPWWHERAEALRARSHRPLRRIRVPRETEVYGREAQLARLREHYDAAAAGSPRVVLLEGEAGIGKTRIADELVVRLRRDGEDPTFLYGSYPPGGAASPAGALRSAFLEALGGDGLEQRLKDHLPDTPHLVPAFAAQLRGDAPPPGAAPLTQAQRREVFVQLARSMATERPLVLVVDDLHFAPVEGRELFAALAAVTEETPMLLVGTARPGPTSQWRAELDRQDHAERIPVERLGPKELTRLLVDALHSREVAQRLAFPIAEKSDGNPFFVFEIVRGLKESGALRQAEDGSWTTSGRIQRIEVPDSVRELMRARIEGLAETDQEILDVAACLGVSFDPGLVAEVLGMSKIPLLRALGRLEREQRLVHASGHEFVFDHHQIHEALYEGQSEALRREYHAVIGHTLAKRAGDEPAAGEAAWQICEHLVRGEQGTAALDHLDATVAYLDQRFLHDAALDLYQRLLDQPGVLEGPRRVQVLLQLSDHLITVSELDDARRVIEEAERVADACGDDLMRLRALSASAWCDKMAGRREEAMRKFEQLYELAKSVGHHRAMAAAVGNTAGLHSDAGDYARAEELATRYLGMVEELGDEAGVTSAIGNLASIMFHLERFEEAVPLYEQHIERAEQHGYLLDAANSMTGLACTHAKVGNLERACEGFERALEITVHSQSRRSECEVLANYGSVLNDLGQYDAGTERLRAALRLAREIGRRDNELFALGGLARSCQWLGEPDEAAALYEEARDVADATGRHDLAGYILRELGTIRERRGDLEGALGLYEEALTRAAASPIRWLECEAECLGLLRRMDASSELTTRYETMRARAAEHEVSHIECLALAWLGRGEDARRLYDAHRATLQPVIRWETLFAIGTSCGDDASLEEAKSEARAYLESVPPGHRAKIEAHASVLPELFGA